MSNEVFTPPRPALPVAPQTPAAELPSRADAPTEQKPPVFGAMPAKKQKKRAAKRQLSKAEIAQIEARRKRSLTAKKAHANRKRAPAAPAAPKNPNRPLEAKNMLQTVLAMTGVLKKPELVMFSDMMTGLQTLTRAGRRRVLDALGKVYP